MARRSGPTFRVSRFNNAKDTNPQSLELSLEELVEALTRFELLPGVQQKWQLAAWSPARYRSGGRRCCSDVLDLSCMVFDLDEGEQVEAAMAAWDDKCFVAHSTWSHTPQSPRLRLVLPLAAPVATKHWKSAWNWASNRTPGVDRVCRDAARIYFLPAVPSPNATTVARFHDGPLLNLEAEMPQCSLPFKAHSDAPDPPVHADVDPKPSSIFYPEIIGISFAQSQKVARRGLRFDPLTRDSAARALGAQFAGTGEDVRAERVRCPNCKRLSVWFYIAPRRATRARCHHVRSCGWSAPLHHLFDEVKA